MLLVPCFLSLSDAHATSNLPKLAWRQAEFTRRAPICNEDDVSIDSPTEDLQRLVHNHLIFFSFSGEVEEVVKTALVGAGNKAADAVVGADESGCRDVKKALAPGNASKEGAEVLGGDAGVLSEQLESGETGKARGEGSSSVYFASFKDRPEATAQQWKLGRAIWRTQEEKRETPYNKLSDEEKRDFFFRSVKKKVTADLLVEQDEEPEDDGHHAAEMAAVAAKVARKRKEFYELVRRIVAGEVVQKNASEHSEDGDVDTDGSVAGN
ncbi:hypothetical protein CAEBREN_01425 [Caenorhabditis brenneri]|uniref:Uncharacterized protein n=1 Tax=Caenorhabditis brenneri TaxID=135651 RepID=G0PIZ0_CAEBE|nr:hypothetical protein CAEBREN_01425 [Caenorhabditis brenneri]